MGLRWYGRLNEGLLSADKLEPSLEWGVAVYTSKYLQSYCPHTHTYSTSGQFSHPVEATMVSREKSLLWLYGPPRGQRFGETERNREAKRETETQRERNGETRTETETQRDRE